MQFYQNLLHSYSEKSNPNSPDFETTIENIPFLCRSESGSKTAQHFVASCRPEQIDQIIRVVSPHLGELMSDHYGSYMCRTLFDRCSFEQRLFLFNTIRDEMVSISKIGKGTRSMQHIIRVVRFPEEEAVFQQAFKGRIFELSMINNGSHAIQVFSEWQNREFFIREILGHVRELASDKLGVMVIKKIIDEPRVFNELLDNTIALMQDKYGNCAFQHMLDYWGEECSLPIINCIKGHALGLCIQKYSSNVMDKCVKEKRMRRAIINELKSVERMQVLLDNPYGCYFLRTAALEIELDQKEGLKRAVLAAIPLTEQKNYKPRWNEILSYLR
ncbi:unnamed protein product [Blepharisma stoltei]|uniref:PUM-HD domain-containing protein n=1 Tax=Blepharisma stoltei TaxID=1481888 RepID=A0AAU9JTD8_9CILI|nr:unnamed protein product [Blepharisma stoltei]